MQKLVLIKIGGSLITDKSKPYTSRKFVITRLAKEICFARKKTGLNIILGHGGGSFPHVPAIKYKTIEGVINKNSIKGISEVQDSAARLNRIVVKIFNKNGEVPMSVNPSSFMLSQNKKPKKIFIYPIIKLLELKMLPVIYGDVVLDNSIGCTIYSTETVLNILADNLKGKYKIQKIIYCGQTDGVYDSEGKTIRNLNSKNFHKFKNSILTSDGIDVTGGMLHKIEEALKASESLGIKIEIINGTKTGELKRSILGQPTSGTIVNF